VRLGLEKELKGDAMRLKSKSHLSRIMAMLFAMLLLASFTGEATVTPPAAPTNLSWDQTNWGQTNWQ